MQIAKSQAEATAFAQKHYTRVHQNLNEGTSASPLHIWYLRVRNEDARKPVIGVCLSHDKTNDELFGKKWKCVPTDVNCGQTMGKSGFLWIKTERTGSDAEAPIAEVMVTTGDPKSRTGKIHMPPARGFFRMYDFPAGDTPANLNAARFFGGGDNVNLWVRYMDEHHVGHLQRPSSPSKETSNKTAESTYAFSDLERLNEIRKHMRGLLREKAAGATGGNAVNPNWLFRQYAEQKTRLLSSSAFTKMVADLGANKQQIAESWSNLDVTRAGKVTEEMFVRFLEYTTGDMDQFIDELNQRMIADAGVKGKVGYHELFDNFDSDHSGRLNPENFADLLASINLDCTQREILKAIERFAPGQEEVSYENFKHIFAGASSSSERQARRVSNAAAAFRDCMLKKDVHSRWDKVYSSLELDKSQLKYDEVHRQLLLIEPPIPVEMSMIAGPFMMAYIDPRHATEGYADNKAFKEFLQEDIVPTINLIDSICQVVHSSTSAFKQARDLDADAEKLVAPDKVRTFKRSVHV